MNIVVRVDSSFDIGAGHLMRCLTLANALRERGAHVSFVCGDSPGNQNSILRKQRYIVYELKAPPTESFSSVSVSMDGVAVDWEFDAQQTIQSLIGDIDKIDWLIVDHFSLDARWEAKIKDHVKKIMVIDNLADRAHNCDLLLDYEDLNGDVSDRYLDHVPERCLRLLGPRYVILRPEFAKMRKIVKCRNGSIKNILIFMGSSDQLNITGQILETLVAVTVEKFHIDVVVGYINPHKVTIQHLCSKVPNATYHCQTSDMASLMARSDLMIGTAGVSIWEACCLGLPSMVIVTAKNQELATKTLATKGILTNLGVQGNLSMQNFKANIRDMFNDSSICRSQSKKAYELVDGDGVEKIISNVLS